MPPASTSLAEPLRRAPCEAAWSADAVPRSTARPGLRAALWLGTLCGVAAVVCLPWHVVLLLGLAPVLEEVVFRAGLQTWLARRLNLRAPRVLPNLLTALAFAALHVALRPDAPVALMALTMMPALFIGWVFERRQRLVPCITLHSAFNALWIITSGALP